MSSEHPNDNELTEGRHPDLPLSDEESFILARRLATGSGRPVLPTTPGDEDVSVELACRVSPEVFAHVRARAHAEHVTVTEVVRSALAAYATGDTGSITEFQSSSSPL